MSTPPPTGPHGLSEAARALLARRATVNPDSGPRRGAASESAPLASPQLGQWLSGEISLSGAVGALPKLLRLEGPLDREALRRALTEIARRHHVLRTVFSLRNGGPVQHVTPPRDVDLRHVDLRSVPAAERESAAAALLDQDARRPFDLSRDLLMRPVLVQVGDQAFELQVTFQHVAFDGWSNGVYLRELGALYSACAAGLDSPLPELSLQYADFAIRERAREATPAFHADRVYWKEHVAGSTSALDLATDRPRRRRRTYARPHAAATIDAPLTTRLSQMALEEGTTLFAVVFAAFQVLVGRRAGRDDFVLGAVSANRTQRETEAMIGSFITVLPLRTQLGDGPTFRTHLRRTAESIVRGFAHQAYPFQRLKADLRPGGDPGVDPLYDVVFNYRNMPTSLPAMRGLTVSDFRAPHLSRTYDLQLNLTPGGGSIALELDYDPDLFHADTAARWLEGYRAVLEAVASNPDSSTAVLPVMPAGESRLLLEEWSGASVPWPAAGLLMDQFETAAAAFPDDSALEHNGLGLSYGGIRTRMRRLAAQLRHAGVAPGDLVGLFAERSTDTITAMLAILSIGAVYVPLDTGAPVLRIDAMLGSAGLRLILTDRPGAPALANRPEPSLLLADLLAAADPPGASSEPARFSEQDPAYVIFTSGSTGVPKGVVVPHDALARYVGTLVETFEARPRDRHLQASALTFDVSIREILLPLVTGGTLVLRGESMFDSPVAYVEQCRTLQLTHIWMPTAFWSEVARSEWPGGMDLGTEVRVLSFGGEAAAPESVRRFLLALSRPLRVFNGYGPTETTIACTRAELSAGGPDLEAVPIGRPLPGATAHVLDDRHQPVPIGVPGELWIGGGNLAIGYLCAPELTAERFVPDPFSAVPGARLYRTGDMVRWLPDGQLTFMGRNDFQVKVRGHRVELQEIERVLLDVPGVLQAAVIHEGDHLIGFVTAHDPTLLSAAAIRGAAALQLPPYLVPSQIVALERLPLGVTGKVDRQRLRAMVPTVSSRGGALGTRTEGVVAKVWEEVLGVTGVGPDDRFLDLGGHSLLAMRVAIRFRAELGIEVTIRTLLSHPTVTALARELDRLVPSGSPPRE